MEYCQTVLAEWDKSRVVNLESLTVLLTYCRLSAGPHSVNVHQDLRDLYNPHVRSGTLLR